MFAYCLNNPVTGIDAHGERTYFINGIHNPKDNEEPEYAKDFCALLCEAGEDTIAIPVYTGQRGFWGYVEGGIEVFFEWFNCYTYSLPVAIYILSDLQANPLAEGETLNIVGYSGGGQIALNVMEMLPGLFDNVILIGAPVLEISWTTTNISMLYSSGDFLSLTMGTGYDSYCVGEYGHDGYFLPENIGDTVNLVFSIINK